MKRWTPIRKLQWYAFLATGPILLIALNYILYKEAVFQGPKTWLLAVPLICIPGWATWYLHCSLSWWLKQKLGGMHQTAERLLIQSLLLLILASVFSMLVFFVYDRLAYLDYQWQAADIQLGVFFTLGLCFSVEALYEANYTFLRYRESKEALQSMERLAESQEIDSLKSLINPHFLFNCFNTLSSLIMEDPKRAKRFLDELSKVYRYLLLTNQQALSPVENEIKFIQSYYQLLNTRYGPALELNIDVAPQYAGYVIPSLSLQLLVENAVKHNIASTDQPLVIDIFTTEGNQLIVNNNLQRKLMHTTSTQIGLENIRAKYKLLHQPGFQIIEDEKNFTVALPLIWSQRGNRTNPHKKSK